jgi:hypothetical protein
MHSRSIVNCQAKLVQQSLQQRRSSTKPQHIANPPPPNKHFLAVHVVTNFKVALIPASSYMGDDRLSPY